MRHKRKKMAHFTVISLQKPALDAYLGYMVDSCQIRIPAAPLLKTLNRALNGYFLLFSKKVRHKVRHNTEIVITEPELKYPYKKAKLVHHNRDLTKRWYVTCWAWNMELKTLQRKRYYGGINRYHTVYERLDAGRQLEAYVNQKLEQGYVIGKDIQDVSTDGYRLLTVSEAFEMVMNKKKEIIRPESYKQYYTTVPSLKKWLLVKGLSKLKIHKLTTSLIHEYLDHLFASGQITSNKTYNNYLGTIRAILNYIIDRDSKLFTRNPAASIKMLPTSSQKHSAYSIEEMAMLKDEMIRQGEHQLLLFVHFIYYTLARPNEIKNLKILNIELDQNRIYIPRDVSKNKKSDYVDIYPPLRKAIEDSGIMQYPGEYYIFSSSLIPGKKKTYRKYFWRKHIKILRALKMDKMDKEYTLYSYKHSGAINLFLSGLDPIDIQKQCRHQTLSQTMEYLRELDLFRKTDHFDKVKSF